MRQDEFLQCGNHEWVGALGEKAVDPELESAAESELRTEDFVLSEDEEEQATEMRSAVRARALRSAIILRIITQQGKVLREMNKKASIQWD